MNTANWQHSFAGLRIDSNAIGKRILCINGPSGVGKTTLATTLENNFRFYKIVPNCTTRHKRATDYETHFKYLTNDVFYEKCRLNEFFLCRVKPWPYYGYLKEDINDIFRQGKIAVFMFRFSGVYYLRTVLSYFVSVFMEADPITITKHSQNSETSPTNKDTLSLLQANRELRDELVLANYPTFIVKNNYQMNLLDAADAVNTFFQKVTCNA